MRVSISVVGKNSRNGNRERASRVWVLIGVAKILIPRDNAFKFVLDGVDRRGEVLSLSCCAGKVLRILFDYRGNAVRGRLLCLY